MPGLAPLRQPLAPNHIPQVTLSASTPTELFKHIHRPCLYEADKKAWHSPFMTIEDISEEKDSCCICLDKYSQIKPPVSTLCGHHMHKSCFFDYLMSQDIKKKIACPVGREDLRVKALPDKPKDQPKRAPKPTSKPQIPSQTNTHTTIESQVNPSAQTSYFSAFKKGVNTTAKTVVTWIKDLGAYNIAYGFSVVSLACFVFNGIGIGYKIMVMGSLINGFTALSIYLGKSLYDIGNKNTSYKYKVKEFCSPLVLLQAYGVSHVASMFFTQAGLASFSISTFAMPLFIVTLTSLAYLYIKSNR